MLRRQQPSAEFLENFIVRIRPQCGGQRTYGVCAECGSVDELNPYSIIDFTDDGLCLDCRADAVCGRDVDMDVKA